MKTNFYSGCNTKVSRFSFVLKIIAPILFIALCLSLAFLPSHSTELFGNGADGVLVVPAGNVYSDSVSSPLLGNNPVNSNAVQLPSDPFVLGFRVGQEVMLITMRDPNPNLVTNLTGQHEFHRIVSMTSNSVVLDSVLRNDYNQSGGILHQILRVPNYTEVAIDGEFTCRAWNGETGGVLAFRVIQTCSVNVGGIINATGKGYRGIMNDDIGVTVGRQGEGVLGMGTRSYNPNGNGGGGGECGAYYSPNNACGGGGGQLPGQNGHFLGTHAGMGGLAVSDSLLSKMIMGGGGGSGGHNIIIYEGNRGGHGGGIILCFANTLVVNGHIRSNGMNGENGFHGSIYDIGAAGGGAGGQIYLSSFAASLGVGNITAVGGTGGYVVNRPTYLGGTGGNGRIRVDGSFTGATNPAIGFHRQFIGLFVTNPNGDNHFTIGSVDTLRWQSFEITGNVNIALNRNYPTGNWEVLFSNTVNDGLELWSVTGPQTTTAKIRISTVANSLIYDVSDEYFSIVDAPAPPQNLSIQKQGDNAVLNWAQVDSTVTGIPISVERYLVFCRNDSTLLWTYLDYTEGANAVTYTHLSALLNNPVMYYHVKAWVGDSDHFDAIVRNLPVGISESDVLEMLNE